MSQTEAREPVLCYIDDERHLAYFTTQALEDQWGDDHEDVPYEHNAGPPYAYSPDYDGKKGIPPWRIVVVEFLATRLCSPAYGVLNSAYSVRDINARKVPWLRPQEDGETEVIIWAGTPLTAFYELIKQAKGMAQQVSTY